jgi:hypothetical protein
MTEIRSTEAPAAGPAEPPEARVWVLDDPRAGTAAQAIGIAERLGLPFRRIPLAWNWMAHLAGLAPGGSLLGLSPAARRAVGDATAGARLAEGAAPDIVLSAARRSAAVALWLKAQFGCKLVHCMSPGLGGLFRQEAFDLLVVPTHDNPPLADNILTILGAPHRVTPLVLHQAAEAWEERLGHLPRPRVALLVGGPPSGTDMQPARAHALARRVARITAAAGGTVLATTSRRTGGEATEAVSAGLSRVMHVLYRWGEPGPNPYLGFLATADAIVVTADSVSMISEACATGAPVFFAVPEQAGRRHRRFLARFVESNMIRPLGDSLTPWARPVLDESGRVAAEIRRRFHLPGAPT